MENRDKFEQDLKMLEYFQSEFEYRHQHYWRILERFFILFMVVATLPILKGLLGIEILGEFNRHVVVFQIAALAIAVIGAAIIGVLRNALVLLSVDSYWQMLIMGVVIIGAVTLDQLRHAKK